MTLRVALVCIGIGRFRRGFERYFSDLAEVLHDSAVEPTLFVGADEGDGDGWHVVPPTLARWTRIAHRLPVGRVDTEYRQYKQDCLAYALALLPLLRKGRFDVVHIIDPPLAKLVERLAPWLGIRAPMLFTNGTAWPVSICPQRAHLHHVQRGSYGAAMVAGDPPSRNTLIPCGIHPQRFRSAASRAELRRCHGIAPDTFVVLVVAAVKRTHKRVDHVIEEVAQLPGDMLLWIDGKPEDADVVALAQDRLGPRCRISYLRSEQVAELYRLCDVMVHAALEESFGLSIVEAMAAACPVLIHDAPHFEWLAGSRGPLVDMTKGGALAARLARVRAGDDPSAIEAAVAARAAQSVERFDWQHLRDDHVALYQRLSAEVRR